MNKISDFSLTPLHWSQPSLLKMEYELHAGETIVGTLKFRSSFGTFATAESADGCWTFKRVGFWQNKASIRACEAAEDLATFTNNTWSAGGSLEFHHGRKFKASTNFWMTSYEFKDDQERVVVRFRVNNGLHLSAQVEIAPEAAGLAELPVLVLFGWYLAIMLHNDSAAAAATAASV